MSRLWNYMYHQLGNVQTLYVCLLGEAETSYGQPGGWEIPTDDDPDREETGPIPAGGCSNIYSIPPVTTGIVVISLLPVTSGIVNWLGVYIFKYL